jgi:nucleotide-binding universal stress UspA family protein
MKEHTFPPRTVLVPTDLGTTSNAALGFARHLHERYGAAVRVLHAQNFDLPPYFSSGQMEALRRELKRADRAAVEYVRRTSETALGFTPEVSVVEGAPADAILQAADDAIELIVMGTHGRHGAERLWLGSVAERVLRESRRPILTTRHVPPEQGIRNVLCPVNLTPVSLQAVQYAAAIARTADAQLTIVHVVEPGTKPLECPLVGSDIRNHCTVREVILHGTAGKTIVGATAELRPDLIVMGAEHKSALLGRFFSTTTETVMQWAGVPLLVVPKTATAAAGAGG